MTQKEKIAKHLKSGKTITTIQAFQKFGCTRLAAVISDLKPGMKIVAENVRINGKNLAKYKLAA